MVDGMPVIKTFAFDDVVSTLSGIAPYDWRSFLRERLDATEMHGAFRRYQRRRLAVCLHRCSPSIPGCQ